MKTICRSAKKWVGQVSQATARGRSLTAFATARQAELSVDGVQHFLNLEPGLALAKVDKLTNALDLTFRHGESTSEEARSATDR